MIDTCDEDICSWSDDGETFVVKNPTKFEKDIIPQFLNIISLVHLFVN